MLPTFEVAPAAGTAGTHWLTSQAGPGGSVVVVVLASIAGSAGCILLLFGIGSRRDRKSGMGYRQVEREAR
jgi:hypothetical protein